MEGPLGVVLTASLLSILDDMVEALLRMLEEDVPEARAPGAGGRAWDCRVKDRAGAGIVRVPAPAVDAPGIRA